MPSDKPPEPAPTLGSPTARAVATEILDAHWDSMDSDGGDVMPLAVSLIEGYAETLARENAKLRRALVEARERAALTLANPRATRTDMLVQFNAINATITASLSPSTTVGEGREPIHLADELPDGRLIKRCKASILMVTVTRHRDKATCRECLAAPAPVGGKGKSDG